MEAVRCPDCGDVRWSFFGFGAQAGALNCEFCGTTMVAERRRPAAATHRAATERRHVAPALLHQPPLAPPLPPAA